MLKALVLMGFATACHVDCDTCNGNAQGQCESCVTGAHLVASPGKTWGNCVCNSGWSTTSDASHCFACHSTCATCSGLTNSDCLTCYANASETAGSCSCAAGYYPNPTSATCSQCPAECLTCTNTPVLQCVFCFPNASVSGTTCACVALYSPNPDVAHCVSASTCHYTCASCGTNYLNPVGCTACFPNAVLSGNPGSCACATNAVASPRADNCVACHSDCATCSVGADATKCLTCKSQATLSGSAPSSCVCISGTYLSGSACFPCDPVCGLCASSGSSACTQCKSSAFLTGPAPNSCQCNPGHYPDPDASNCQQCSSECYTCESATECLTCHSNAVLASGKCQCVTGTYPADDAGNCQKCAEGCASCSSTECYVCDSGWNYYSKQCFRKCPVGYEAVNGLCQYSANQSPPLPSLSVSTSNDLTLSFDKDMQFSLFASDVSVEVTDSDSKRYSVVWSIPIVRSQRTFDVQLSLNATYLPADNSVLFVFVHPEAVVDTSGIAITVTELVGTLYPLGDTPSNGTVTLPGKEAAGIVGSAAILTSVTAGFISGSPSSLWSLLNQLQLITYIPMTRIPISEDFASTLNALTLDSFVPNPFEYADDSGSHCTQPPHFASNYGLKASTFLVNTGMMMTGGLCALVLFLALQALGNTELLAPLVRKFLPSFKWGVPLRWWIQAYLDAGVFSMIQVYAAMDFPCLLHPYFAVNSVFALFSFCIVVFTPYRLLRFMRFRFQQITTRDDLLFNLKYGELFTSLRKEARECNFYYTLFIVRRLCYALIIVGFSKWPKVQALVGTSLALTVRHRQMFLYVAVCRPFRDRMDQLCESSLEFSTFIVFSISSCFVFNFSSSTLESIGTAGVWAVVSSIGFNALLSLIRLCLSVAEVVKTFKAEVNKKVSIVSVEPLRQINTTFTKRTPDID